MEQQFRILGGQIDGLDFRTIDRHSRRRARKAPSAIESGDVLADELVTGLVAQLETRQRTDVPVLTAEMLLRAEAERGDGGASEQSESCRVLSGSALPNVGFDRMIGAARRSLAHGPGGQERRFHRLGYNPVFRPISWGKFGKV